MTDTSSPARPGWSWPETRSLIAVVATLAFVGAYALPWIASVPKGAEQYVGQMQGALLTQWALILGWYFGSSKSTAAVRDQLGKALDKLPDA